MVKKITKAWKDPHRIVNGKVETLSVEGHMEIFRKLARIVNMHGTPGERRKKGGG